MKEDRKMMKYHLELTNDEVAYETLKLHDEEEIGMLKSRVEELEKENAELKERIKYLEYANS